MLTSGDIAAASENQQKLSQAGYQFCLIGGVALQRWGEPRYTQDVDLTLLCPFGEELAVGRRLEALVPPRINEAVAFAVESRVYLGETANGTPVDIALGAIEFEHRCVHRASDYEIIDGVVLRTCGADDLIVMKAFANRDRDWVDVGGIIVRQGSTLDWDLIESELAPLLAVRGGRDVSDRLSGLRSKYANR